MMFKRIAQLIVLLMALAGVSSLALGETVILTSEKSSIGYGYVFNDGDTLYMFANAYLGVWHPGEANATDYRYAVSSANDICNYYPFFDGGKLYTVIAECESDEDGNAQLSHTSLFTLTLSDSEAVCEKVCDLDWSELSFENGDSTLPCNPEQVLAMDGKAYILFKEPGKNGSTPHVAKLTIEDESVKLLDDLEDICGMTTYKDGKLLLLQQRSGDTEVKLITYDPTEEEDEQFAEFEVAEGDNATGLAYDANNDVALYWAGGMVNAIKKGSGEPGEALATVPVRNWYDNAGAQMMPDGRYAVASMQTAVIDLSAGIGERVTLTVNDTRPTFAVDDAIQLLRTSDPNITVNKDNSDKKLNKIVENLMNQDDSVDVYVIKTSSPLYDALARRGFMSRLDGSAAIVEHVGEMYPAIQDAVTINGHIVALPVEASVTSLGFSDKTLQKLGMSLKDVPDNWGDALDFMGSLKDGIEENDLHFVFSYIPIPELRKSLFEALMKDYRTYMAAHPNMGFNSELLRGLLEKLDKIDLEGLGVAEDKDSASDEDMTMIGQTTNEKVLLNNHLIVSYNTDVLTLFTPTLMKMNDEDTARMNISLTVAFINPYSKHPEAAMKLMEALTRSLQNDTVYTMKPGLNTPVRGKANEQLMQEQKEILDQKKRQLEKAEGMARVTLQTDIEYYEEMQAILEKYYWEISQRDIDWFRAHDDNIAVEGVNWLETEEELVDQYINGDISPDELLEAIDHKIRMMQMEDH